MCPQTLEIEHTSISLKKAPISRFFLRRWDNSSAVPGEQDARNLQAGDPFTHDIYHDAKKRPPSTLGERSAHFFVRFSFFRRFRSSLGLGSYVCRIPLRTWRTLSQASENAIYFSHFEWHPTARSGQSLHGLNTYVTRHQAVASAELPAGRS